MAGRLARRNGRDGNPLRRPVDRVEDRCMVALLALLVLAGPVLAWWAARETYAEEVRAAAWESRHRFAVHAVLLEAATMPTVAERAGSTARARWSAPDGSQLTGDLVVAREAAAGTAIRVWTDESGALTGPPAQRIPLVEAVGVAVAVMAGLAVAISAVRGLLRVLFDRHRMRSWRTGWLAVEPLWSHHR